MGDLGERVEWNDSFSSSKTDPYDPLSDPHNLYAHRHSQAKNRTSPRRKKKLAPIRRRRYHEDKNTKQHPRHSRFVDSARRNPTSTMVSIPDRIREDKERADMLRSTCGGETTKSTSVQNGGITFFMASGGADELSTVELDVTKCILLRETYFKRCADALRDGNTNHNRNSPQTLVDDLDRLRIVSIETVEAILKWKEYVAAHVISGTSRQYMWNGLNYLLKMPLDMSILCEPEDTETCKERTTAYSQNTKEILHDWLGFSLARNPFIVPDSLLALEGGDGADAASSDSRTFVRSLFGDTRLDRSKDINVHTKRGSGNDDARTASTTFHSIGGRALANDEKRTSPRSATLPILSANEDAVTRPYETAVVNESVVRRKTAQSPSRQKKRKQKRILRRQKQSTLVHFKNLRPSTLGDIDLHRIRAAERAILDEEREHGRLVRDEETGRVVPAIVHSRQNANMYLGRVRSKKTSESPKVDLRCVSRGELRRSMMVAEGIVDDDAKASETSGAANISLKGTTGKQKGYKSGGELVPLTRRSSKGSKQRPVSLSAEARLDDEIRRLKRRSDEISARCQTAERKIRTLRESIAVARDEDTTRGGMLEGLDG